jgi:hypothetical protein
MRRKKRFGVYSNNSIKRCFCNNSCGLCKGICKSYYPNHCDHETNWHGYFEPSRRKLNQEGFGSLMPGKKFAQYDRMHTFTYRYQRDMEVKYKRSKKRYLKEIAKEEYKEHFYYLATRNEGVKI